MSLDYADLEIGLHRRGEVDWAVELRFSQPDSDADSRLSREDGVATLDLDKLRELQDDSVEYGRELGRGLLGPAGIQGMFRDARHQAESRRRQLRVRLFVGPNAQELHCLRWETLRDPEDDSKVFMSENVLLSRYLSSLDWRPVGPRVRSEASALVVVANPVDLESFDVGRPLPPLDVPDELDRARAAMRGMKLIELPGADRPTVGNLVNRLREGCDVLYLACHGYVMPGGAPQVLLEDDTGFARRVPGIELVERIRSLPSPPRLVVLASCQSAGTAEGSRSGDGGVLATLGPRLAEAGVPAVLAMQGDISMPTVSEFMPTFFRELLRDGQIDRAASVARREVGDRFDWWVPALFMRLRSGRLWYGAGSTTRGRGFPKWPSLIDDIRDGECTPIVGTGVTDALLGSRRDIAQRWASTFLFPLAPHSRDELPQVAQWLSVDQNPRFPRKKLMEYLRTALLERYGNQFSEEVREGPLDDLLVAAWKVRHGAQPDDPLAVLARLPFPLYVTTHMSNLLADALREAGRTPRVEVCSWTEDVVRSSDSADSVSIDRPTPERPLIYHLFGHITEPSSVVLTEDDYFKFLIRVSQEEDRIPLLIQRALADRGLLFLGFRLDDWDFRIVYSILSTLEGSRRRNNYTNVAVQIDPEEGRTLDPDGARRYLEHYFGGRDINIFWGSSDDFLDELHHKWNASSR